MSQSLLAYLDRAPSLDEMIVEFKRLGLRYRHTLPADGHWRYPLHVFGTGDLRVVYHQGNPDNSQAMVNTTVRRADTTFGAIQLRFVSSSVIRRWGGEIYDPQSKRKVALNEPHFHHSSI